MTMMSIVTPENVSRISTLFKPFPPEPLDQYLSIRTYNRSDPVIHCLSIREQRVNEALMYTPGFYVYATGSRADDENLLWYNPFIDVCDLDEVISNLNCSNVFNQMAMQGLGFTSAFF